MTNTVFSGRALPAEEALQVSGDPLSPTLVSDHILELRQEAVHQLQRRTPQHIRHLARFTLLPNPGVAT